MKFKLAVILLSVTAAVVFSSGGYGLWEKKLTIKGTIEVGNTNEKKLDEQLDAFANKVTSEKTLPEEIISDEQQELQIVADEVY